MKAIKSCLAFVQARLKRFEIKAFDRGSEILLIVCGSIVGVAAGCAVSGMSWISKALHSVVFGIAHDAWLSSSRISNPILLVAAPIGGGLILGLAMLLLRRRRPVVDPIEANALYGGRLSLTDSIIVAAQNL